MGPCRAAIIVAALFAILLPALRPGGTAALAGGVYDQQDVLDRTVRIAARTGDTERVREALDHGGKIDGRSERGITALMNAARNCHVETLRLLITRAANLDFVDNRGRTAIMFAASNSCLPAVQELLAKGVKVDLKDKAGRDAFDYATSAATLDYDGDATECVRLLHRKPRQEHPPKTQPGT